MFKYNKGKLEKTMDLYMANEWWEEVYDQAPSNDCRRLLRLMFYKSDNGEPVGEEYEELKEEIYKGMEKEDWKYLYKVIPGPFRKVCEEHMGNIH